MTLRECQRGFTLIEMMVVIVIIALSATAVSLGISSSSRSQLRSSTVMLMSASKYAFSRAVSRGVTVRLVIDLETGSLQIQETSARVVLNRQDETGEGLKRQDVDEEMDKDGNLTDGSLSSKLGSIGPDLGLSNSTTQSTNPLMNMIGGGAAGASGLTDPYLLSMQQGVASGKMARYHGPTFEEIEGSRGKSRTLKGKVKVQRVFSPHAPSPIEAGKAFIYFFPGGTTEHTFIQMNDGSEDEPLVYTVEILPISGRAVLHQLELEPRGDLDDVDEVSR